jgi:hypothetical protein
LPTSRELASVDKDHRSLSSYPASAMPSRMHLQSNAGPSSLHNVPIGNYSPSDDNFLPSWPSRVAESEHEDSRPTYVAGSFDRKASFKQTVNRKGAKLDKSHGIEHFPHFPQDSTSHERASLFGSSSTRTAGMVNAEFTDQGMRARNDNFPSHFEAYPTTEASLYAGSFSSGPSVLHSRLYDSQFRSIAPFPTQQLAQQHESLTYLPSDRRLSEERRSNHRALASHLWQQQQQQQQQQQHHERQASQNRHSAVASPHFENRPVEARVDRIVSTTTSQLLSHPERLPMFDSNQLTERIHEEQKQRRNDREDDGNDDASILTLDSCSGMVDFLDDVDL